MGHPQVTILALFQKCKLPWSSQEEQPSVYFCTLLSQQSSPAMKQEHILCLKSLFCTTDLSCMLK